MSDPVILIPFLLCVALFLLALLVANKAGLFRREFQDFVAEFTKYTELLAAGPGHPLAMECAVDLGRRAVLIPDTMPKLACVLMPRGGGAEGCWVTFADLPQGQHRVDFHLPGDPKGSLVTLHLSLKDGGISWNSLYPDGQLPFFERHRALPGFMEQLRRIHREASSARYRGGVRLSS